MKKLAPKLLLISIILLLIFLFQNFGLSEYLTLDYIKQNQARFQDYYAQNTMLTLSIFLTVYVLSTALSLPGAVNRQHIWDTHAHSCPNTLKFIFTV